MNTEHRQQKISFWHSMKTQFIAVVILVAAVIVILYTLMIMPGVKSNIRSIYSDYLLDLSISYGREMESAMQVNIDLLDNPEAAQDILQQLDIAGAKTAYAYLVGFDGTMLYHPTAEKIGQPVENDAVKKMLKEIQGGSIPKPETVQYVFQGEKKFAACYTSKKQFILVVTADDADLLAPALMLEQRGILISGVLLLLGALAAFVFATRITRPLSKITDSVNRIAQLDLRNDQVLEQCAAHRGEVGSIANAVLRMKEALTEIVQKIRQQSGQLFDASETLNNNAVKTAGNVNNVETPFTLLELPEARLPENPSPGEIEAGLEKEAELIFSKIPKGSWFCVLTPEGKELSSEAFADKLRDVKNSGKSSACFLIGSSFGISPRVKQRADFRLSMGAMTFPHHLARIMVLEQLYRAEAIQSGSKYHK